ncbi:sodium calcium exchanger protein, partial [Moniliophthora roreri]
MPLDDTGDEELIPLRSKSLYQTRLRTGFRDVTITATRPQETVEEKECEKYEFRRGGESHEEKGRSQGEVESLQH